MDEKSTDLMTWKKKTDNRRAANASRKYHKKKTEGKKWNKGKKLNQKKLNEMKSCSITERLRERDEIMTSTERKVNFPTHFTPYMLNTSSKNKKTICRNSVRLLQSHPSVSLLCTMFSSSG